MEGRLGEKLGEGAFSDVHAWADGQVLKLFKAGVRRRIGVHEARMTRAARAAGLPAPEVFGEVMLDGRFGIVLQRLDGPTLMQLARSGAMTAAQAGAILASVAASLHGTLPPPDVPSLRDRLAGSFQLAGGTIPDHVAAGVLSLIDRLPPGDQLCHGDLHTGNVILTADGPRLVDWTGAMRAPAAVDLGITHLLLSELVPEMVDEPERPRAVDAALQAEYARLQGTSPAALRAAMEPYLPIVHVFPVLAGWPSPPMRERLLRRVEAGLR